jgi:hypothetical protein
MGWVATPVVLAVLLGSTLPGGQAPRNGAAEPSTPWHKSAGEFGAMLLLTDQIEELQSVWNQPASRRPEFHSVSSMHRGGSVASVVAFRGCRAGQSGTCNAHVDFRLLRPDKSVYGEQKQVVLWKGQPQPIEQGFRLGFGAFGMRVEPDDPLGVYTFEATVVDRNANVKLVLTQELRVEDRPQE